MEENWREKDNECVNGQSCFCPFLLHFLLEEKKISQTRLDNERALREERPQSLSKRLMHYHLNKAA